MSSSLLPIEIAALERLEKIIEKGKQTFVDVGMALTKIREQRLYRRDYDSFEAYCQGRWGWSRHRASQLEAAASVVQGLPSKVLTAVNTEAAARELAKVPEEKRVEVIKQAQKANGTVSAPAIKAAAVEVVTPPKEVDETGYQIPSGVLDLWHRREEITHLQSALSKLKCEIEKALKDHDQLYAYLSNTIITHFQGTYYALSECKPYAVCLHCQGHPETKQGGCPDCKNTGFITKKVYETGTNKDLAAFRERSIKLKGQSATQKLPAR